MAFAGSSLRATDLAGGLVFYPALAIGSALLACTAGLVAWRTKAPHSIRLQTAGAAVATLLVLAVTTQAAPTMFRIGASPNDAALLEPLTERFTALTNARALLAEVGAIGLLCALTTCAIRAARDT